MPVSINSRLGRYEILSRIGAGGMGEVYRARDTKLERDVAIKVLPEAFARNGERMARFEREAKLLAVLNHPNIAAIYGIEESGSTDALVMELAEGPTLADRVASGPIPLADALPIARQIAEALEYAHEHGVVHRDLKPANIKISRDDSVKILDFGLAKAIQGEADETDGGNSPTVTDVATQAGVLLGTAAYMSPEQAKGKPVDRRADIWAFGSVLFEMLTGRKAFPADSVSETLAAVLKSEPDWSLLPTSTPIHVRVLLDRCLQKDPKQRLRDIGDARISLDEVLSGKAATTSGAAALTPFWRWALPWALLGATAILCAFLYWGKRPPAAEPVRFELPLTPGNISFTLSPNGLHLAYLAPGPDGRNAVWVRDLDSLEPHLLPGTEDVGTPQFWSPDSRFIVFQTGTRLEKIESSGGPPQPICDVTSFVLGGSWNSQGTIIFGTVGHGILQVPAEGGVATPVTTVSGRNEVHVFPSFLPDGKHFIYLRAPDNPGIYIGSLDLNPEQQSSRLVLATPVMAVYTPPVRDGMGRLFFVRAGSLLTQRFDERQLAPAGEPVVVTRRVATYLLSGNFSASSNGVLAYRTADVGVGLSVLNWFDRKGKNLGAVGEAGSYHYFDLGLSPDATRVAATRVSGMSLGESIGMWLFDLDRGVGARLTFDPSPDSSPVWSPDGKRIAFAAVRAGGTGIYQKASNGTPSEQVLVSPTAELKVADDWSRDGHFLLYAKQDPATNTDLWIVPLTSNGTPGGPAAPFADTKFNEDQGQFAPDTRWVAYVSDESGRFEVYVRPFPTPAGGGGKIQVSRGGGLQPRWRRDGKELFYLSLDGNMMAVDVTLGPVLRAGVPESLFQVSVARNGRESPVDAFAWDVTADGKRFLINTAEKVSQPVTVVLNWDAELPKR